MRNSKFKISGINLSGELVDKYYATYGSAYMALQTLMGWLEVQGYCVADRGEYFRVLGEGVIYQIDEVA